MDVLAQRIKALRTERELTMDLSMAIIYEMCYNSSVVFLFHIP